MRGMIYHEDKFVIYLRYRRRTYVSGRQIHAAIFDMDGLLIDSEPLWDQAELEVIESLGVDISRRDELPDMLGLRIDLVVDLWFAQQPWKGADRAEVTARIISRAIELVEASRPLLPGVRSRRLM